MTHYRMLDRAPSCAILHNRNELKVYQGNIVYLNNGDNFELRFFNPLSYKIGIEINFNGIKKGDGYLVLNPGQDLILDRFLDEQRKMIFETYTIDGNNEAAVKAIEKNGLITFNFYKEHFNQYNHNYNIDVNYSFPPKPVVYNYNYNYYGAGTYGLSGPSGASGSSGSCGSSGIAGTPASYSTFSTRNTNTRTYSKSFQSLSENFECYLAESETEINYNDYIQEQESLETGRIEKGEISNQKLRAVNAQFEYTPFHSVTYQLLPYSTMNRTISEVREYCTCCGYRLRKSSWKFCPKCGTKTL